MLGQSHDQLAGTNPSFINLENMIILKRNLGIYVSIYRIYIILMHLIDQVIK